VTLGVNAILSPRLLATGESMAFRWFDSVTLFARESGENEKLTAAPHRVGKVETLPREFFMTAKNGVKFIAKVGAALGAAAALGFVSPAFAAAAPAVSATPSSGLAATQSITVSASGLPANDVFHIGQCVAVSATDFACNYATSVDATSTASGTLSKGITVNRTFTGTTASGATVAVDCKVSQCQIGVFNDEFVGGAVNISFS
jgi:hypothetical protein